VAADPAPKGEAVPTCAVDPPKPPVEADAVPPPKGEGEDCATFPNEIFGLLPKPWEPVPVFVWPNAKVPPPADCPKAGVFEALWPKAGAELPEPKENAGPLEFAVA